MRMMNVVNKLGTLGTLALVSASWAAAQGPMHCCMRSGMPRYDTATEATFKGTVAEVRQHSRSGMAGTGTDLLVKRDDQMLDVHLGPTDFLAAQQMTFTNGDQIEVTGSKVRFGDADAIIAREVKKGDKTLTLRDAQGVPKWSRGRWR